MRDLSLSVLANFVGQSAFRRTEFSRCFGFAVAYGQTSTKG